MPPTRASGKVPLGYFVSGHRPVVQNDEVASRISEWSFRTGPGDRAGAGAQARGIRCPRPRSSLWSSISRGASSAVRGHHLTEAREALLQLDLLWDELFPAEQARIVQLLIERVDVRMHGVEVRLRPNGSPGWCGK